jgi:hypothetical protein
MRNRQIMLFNWAKAKHIRGQTNKLERFQTRSPTEAKRTLKLQDRIALGIRCLCCLIGCEVPHWRTSGFYDALIAGVPYENRPRRIKMMKFCAQDEDDWDAGDALALMPTDVDPRGVRRKRLGSKGPRPEAVIKSDSSGSGTGSSSNASESDPDEAEQISSVPSSSSSSSSSDADEAKGSDEGPAAGIVAGIQAAEVLRIANADAGGEDFGLVRMTKVIQDGVHSGWEVNCKHPHHQAPLACRKNLRLNGHGRTAELTTKMLKTWASWGALVGDRATHHGDVWKRVLKAVVDGTLPDDPEPPFTCFL